MHDITPPRHLLLVVADGLRPDVLSECMDRGDVPTLAALRTRGSYHEVSASFPSVTGPAYVPFLMGRHPARVGLPGLRWYDRARSLKWAPAQARSYAGIDIWHVDHDVDRTAPTLFELARPSLSAMSMLGRGASQGRIGRSIAWMWRVAAAHFRGDLETWRRVEQMATQQFLDRFAQVRPRFSVLAVTGPDKFAHQRGPFSEIVRRSVLDIEQAVTMAKAHADRDGWGDRLHVWLVGDHGHAPVKQHDDLHGWLESESLRVLAHPGLFTRRPDVALMVGGNAMAHIYLEPQHRTRRWWGEQPARWHRLHDRLLTRPSVDLLVVAESETITRVEHASRGAAQIVHTPADQFSRERWSYRSVNGGDPLQLGGTLEQLDAFDAWTASVDTDYPDALVQLALLAPSARAGDIIISASREWDLRARYEPVTHVSTHGALLRDQMSTPLLLDLAPARAPQRTADVVPSALDLLGLPPLEQAEARSFLRAG